MTLASYNLDPDLNTSISGIDVAEDCNPANVNNAIRQVMADLARYNIDTVADIREVQDDADRAITVPVGELGSQVPSAGLRANKVVLFDSSGNAGVASFATIYAGTQAVIADNRTIMGAMAGVTVGQAVVLTEAYRGGMFEVRAYSDYSALVTADTREGIAVRSVADPTKVFVRQHDGILRPRYFGAVGDGTTNDTNAFLGMSAVLNYWDGGTIELEPKTYLVGLQSFAGSSGLGYSYHGQTGIITVDSCTKAVTIHGNGAKLKLPNGYKFGSYDPVTGIAAGTSTDPDKAAKIVDGLVSLTNNTGSITIHDIDLDGNVANIALGGHWGDTGWQIPAHGIWAYGNDILNMWNVNSHHFPTDGMVLGYTGLDITTAAKPVSMTACKFEYNGRQGLSIVGNNAFTAVNCIFSHTGKNGVVFSAPGAGVDIEAESAINRNGLFSRCEFVDNGGAGLVADSGDSADYSFERCRFIGTTNVSVWPFKPGFKFHDCLIVGQMLSIYSSTDVDKAAQFFNCRFSSSTALSPTGVVYGAALADLGGSGQNVLFDNCTFEATGAVTLPIGMNSSILRYVTATQAGVGTSTLRGVFSGVNIITSAGANDFSGSPQYKNYGRLVFNGVAQDPSSNEGNMTVAAGKKFIAKSTAGMQVEISYTSNTFGLIESQEAGVDWTPLHIKGKEVSLWYAGTETLQVRNGYINLVGAALRISETQVLTVRQAAIPDATGGATVDAEARAAINTWLARARTHGLIS